MNEGLQYDIHINKPKQIDVTKEQFYKLSYMGIVSLFCSFEVVLHYEDNGDIKLYSKRLFNSNYRFTDIEWFEKPSIEVYTCTIPKGHKLISTIEKYFSHLIMK